MRFEIKDFIKGLAFVAGFLVYYFTVSMGIEIRIVKLEASSANVQEILKEIRSDVKNILTNRKER